ncbi:MAG: protease complex subunit PrcB family protein [Flavobacteriaceae bacterium]
MKKIFLTVILSMMLMSCSSDDNESFSSQNMEFSTIARFVIGNTPFLDNSESQNIIISDSANWEDFLVDLEYHLGYSIDSINIDSSVDFETYQVISVFDQIRPTGGFGISVISVIENQNNIIVNLETSYDDGITFQMPIQPFHIVKIPKSDKPVVFE